VRCINRTGQDGLGRDRGQGQDGQREGEKEEGRGLDRRR
jgi:hypothetical protein